MIPAKNALSLRRYESFALGGIDETNDLCRLRRRPGCPSLTESIRRYGILNPLLIYPSETGGHELICGFRRLRSCRDLGLEYAPAQVVETNLDETARLSLALWDNLSGTDFSAVEKAEIVKKFLPCMDRRELIGSILPLLALNPHERDLKRFLAIADLPESVKTLIEQDQLSLDAALKLSDFNPEAVEALAGFVATLNFGVNKQCEIMELMFEICRREDTDASELLRSGDLEAIDLDIELNRPQKSARVRELLKKRRYPRLTEAEERFDEWLRSLRLAGTVSVKHPPYFEGTTRRVEFSARSHQELGDTLRVLWDLYNNGKLAPLFDDEYGL